MMHGSPGHSWPVRGCSVIVSALSPRPCPSARPKSCAPGIRFPRPLQLDHTGGKYVAALKKSGEQFGPGRAIKIEQSKCPASDFVSGQTHAGNIDVMRSKNCSDSSDDAGDVVIFEHENDPAGRRFDGLAVDANDPWFVPRSKKGAADGDAGASTPNCDVQPFVKIGLFCRPDLLNRDAASGGHRAHVDAVHLFTSRVFEKSGQNGASDGV